MKPNNPEPARLVVFCPPDPDCAISFGEWARDRGLTYWNRCRPNYPAGIRNTPWERIVWEFTLFLP